MSKYKYYFKKPRSEIAKDIIKTVGLAGLVLVAANSPTFVPRLWQNYRRWHRHPRKKFYDTFYRLMKGGHLTIERRGYDLKISLTPKGRRVVGWMQIDALQIKEPRKWDGKWRVVIFDIKEVSRNHRDAFRAKLKELGFRYLQRSVWLHPYDCRDELELLRDFFGFEKRHMILIVADYIDRAALPENSFPRLQSN